MAREWGNKAAWARDDTAQLLHEIVREARGLLEHKDPAVVLGAAKILDKAQRGKFLLAAVGAQVSDDQL